MIEKLDATHDVEPFACGKERLARFLKRFALMNQNADSARTYVACRGSTVLAYPWIAPFMGQGVQNLAGNVLDQRPVEDYMQELPTAADVEHRHVALERAAGHGEFEIGLQRLEFDGIVPLPGSEQGRVDVEVAAGDDQSVDGVEVCGRPCGRVRQEHGQSARAVERQRENRGMTKSPNSSEDELIVSAAVGLPDDS